MTILSSSDHPVPPELKSLTRQFFLTASALVLVAFGVVALWLSSRLEAFVVSDVSQRGGTYLQTIVAPHLGAGATEAPLSPEASATIDRAIAQDPADLGITQIKVWNLSGLNIYDTDKTEVGLRTEPSAEMLRASRGEISSGLFDSERRLQHLSDPFLGMPDVEIYLPLRDPQTGEVVAIAEFYQTSEHVLDSYYALRRESWFLTLMVSLLLIAGMYVSVVRARRIILRQRQDLDVQVEEMTRLLAENTRLQDISRTATQRSIEDQEVQLRRVGADLHDGVGQLISIATLRLSDLFEKKDRTSPPYLDVKHLLSEALSEIRLIAAGLALPEIEEMTFRDAVQHIVSRHRKRTGTEVNLRLTGHGPEPSHPIKLYVCRFIQETLTNAFKYANGQGQRVTLRMSRSDIGIEVSDDGPGLDTGMIADDRPRLGLLGLRNRSESLGGTMDISSREGGGTVVRATLRLNADTGAPAQRGA